MTVHLIRSAVVQRKVLTDPYLVLPRGSENVYNPKMQLAQITAGLESLPPPFNGSNQAPMSYRTRLKNHYRSPRH